MRVLRWVLAVLAALALALAVVVLVLASGWLGELEGPGEVAGDARPASETAARTAGQRETALRLGASAPKQILFGDFHVHTTFSFDAFMASLPMTGGEGARPPADACDFARHCAQLDFWSVNDHAEGLTRRQWDETVRSIRECNAVAGDPENPDTVAFLGWEWSQISFLPETHYGHKNVVLRHTGEERIPARPIGATSDFARGAGRRLPIGPRVYLGVVGGQRGRDFVSLMLEAREAQRCEEGRPVRELPPDCRELVATPAELFAKLDDWGHDSIVIPHGNAWGLYTPPGSTWDKQLAAHDPERETMMEVYSGHGNSEVHRDFRAAILHEDGTRSCPEPSPDYLPSCWHAGEMIRQRCAEAGETEAECETRAVTARQHYVDALLAGRETVPGSRAEDWLDAGQCRGCFQPAFRYRPGGSAQYMLAVRDFDGDGEPRRFRMAFIGSSDIHTARAGSGYKEVARGRMTDSRGHRGEGPQRLPLVGSRDEPDRPPRSEAFDPTSSAQRGLGLFDFERVGSFMVTGGLVAVHAEGRSRDAIWDALARREVYATSGPRILLWFDLLNEGLPMGSSAELAEEPFFRVRAAGSLEQAPGCPAHVEAALGAERTGLLCVDECYHPGDVRRPIDRIEIVRIRPQSAADEPIGELIDDPWRVFPCEPGGDGCTVTFSDSDFTGVARDTVYYARALETSAPLINGQNLRCTYDDAGRCIEVDPCAANKPYDDDCLSEAQPRAWSSPIFVDWAAGSSTHE